MRNTLLIVASCFLVLVGFIYVGNLALGGIQNSRNARTMVREWADKLGEEQKNAPDLEYPATLVLPQTDPWGNSLVAAYHAGAVQIVTVRSAGRDGRYATRDDYSARSAFVDGKKVKAKILRGVEQTSESVGRGLIRGGRKGLKDELRDDK